MSILHLSIDYLKKKIDCLCGYGHMVSQKGHTNNSEYSNNYRLFPSIHSIGTGE